MNVGTLETASKGNQATCVPLSPAHLLGVVASGSPHADAPPGSGRRPDRGGRAVPSPDAGDHVFGRSSATRVPSVRERLLLSFAHFLIGFFV